MRLSICTLTTGLILAGCSSVSDTSLKDMTTSRTVGYWVGEAVCDPGTYETKLKLTLDLQPSDMPLIAYGTSLTEVVVKTGQTGALWAEIRAEASFMGTGTIIGKRILKRKGKFVFWKAGNYTGKFLNDNQWQFAYSTPACNTVITLKKTEKPLPEKTN